MSKSFEIIVSPQGVARHIYSEEAASISAVLGPQEIRRASHVEPTAELSAEAYLWLARHRPEVFQRDPLNPGAWWADMLPVEGPVLGPFADRQLALDAEVTWLKERNIPTCPTGTC